MTLREFTGFSTELLSAYRRNEARRRVIEAVQRERIDDLLNVARTTRRWRGLTQLLDAPVLTKHDVIEDFSAGLVSGAP